jgi:hypothetical protein
MQIFYRSVLLAIVLEWAVASQCGAHQKWLWPNSFNVSNAPVWISFDVTWSDAPFTAETGVGNDQITIIGPGNESVTLSQVFTGKTKSTGEVELGKAGTYRLQAVDPLTYWTRVEQDGKQKWFKKPKGEVVGVKITRSDLYWSKAMAYVTIGKASEIPRPDDAEPLEIVLDTHPNQIVAGGKLELRVLSYGKPVTRARINVFGASAAGHDPSQTIECDEEGVGRLQLDEPGRYLVSCELEREVPDDPKADVHSFNLYLTLLVQPPLK